MSADDRADLYASISFGRPASSSVGVPEYPGAVFTHVPTDVVTGDGIAADLVATSGTNEDADELGERHVTGDQRDVASASETDGSVDVPVHTQDAGDGSSPTRTPPVVSGTPTSSAPARSDVDDRVHEHRSALPPAPVRDPDDGSPAQLLAARPNSCRRLSHRRRLRRSCERCARIFMHGRCAPTTSSAPVQGTVLAS